MALLSSPLEARPITAGAVGNGLSLFMWPFKRKGNFDSRDIVALLSPANQEKLYEILEKRGDEFVRYEG